MSKTWQIPSEFHFKTINQIKPRFVPFSTKTLIYGSLFKNAMMAVQTQLTLYAAPLI